MSEDTQPPARQTSNAGLPNNDQMPQPVAYDREGRPLYTTPYPAANNSNTAGTAVPSSGAVPANASPSDSSPQFVYVTRPVDPGATEIPADILQRHKDSQKRYPQLNLSEGEFIISAVKRHAFGLVQIWATAIALIGAFLAMLLVFLSGGGAGIDTGAVVPAAIAILGVMFALILAGAVVASYIYNNNRFYLTNESVIQEIQNGLFSRHEQTVSLSNIEDASYMQAGILPAMFNFGTIRLSTEGDETTYRFSYVSDPKKEISTLNNAVEAFKNGRRVH